MLLDLYIDLIKKINISTMPEVHQAVLIILGFVLGVGIGILDIILFPIEFIIWIIKEKVGEDND